MGPLIFYFFCRITMSLGYALAVADMASTVRALYYGAREANPGWRWVLEALGKVAFMIGRVALGLLIVWLNVGNAYAPFVWYVILAALIPLVVLAYVVRSNWRKGDALREQARSKLQ